MERQANYAVVGIITSVLGVALVAFVVWLAGFSFNRKYDVYDVRFTGPVNGLSQGGDVRFNGIKVGEIARVFLDPTDANRVIARVRLDVGVPVKVDSVATTQLQGLTGSSFIQITGGSPSQPLLRAVTRHGRIPVIQSRPSALAGLLAGGGDVVQRAAQTLDRVNRLLSDQNIERLSGTIQSLHDVAEELAQRRGAVTQAEALIQNANQAALSLTELARSSNSLVNGDVSRAAANLAAASENLKQTTSHAQQIMARLDRPTSDFAATSLPRLSETIASLQETSRTLDSLARQLQQSPRGVLARPPGQELKLKQ